MTIGETIRTLRKTQDVTQEMLAEYLHISTQAVSKWETNASLPDIAQIVPLSHFFGVSTDTLLGVTEQAEEEAIAAFEAQLAIHRQKGEVRQALALCRMMLGEYPRKYRCMEALATVLHTISDCCPGFTEAEQGKAREEAVTLFQRILRDCTEDGIRSHARASLVMLYDRIGKVEEALALAKEAPSLYQSREILQELSWHQPPEVQERIAKNALQLTDLLVMNITFREYASPEEKRHAIQSGIRIWQTVVDDGNYLFHHTRMRYLYILLARVCLQLGERDEALNAVRQAVHHAREADSLPAEGAAYTGAFVAHARYTPRDTSRNYIETEVQCTKSQLQETGFAALREEPAFIAILEQLAQEE